MQLSQIQNKIHEIRGQKIVLDFDLAEMYEVETRVLKQAVKRNMGRFPKDFMFELTKEEFNGRGQHSKYLSYAFTEQGVAMRSTVLNSEKAIEVTIAIIRTFVLIRQHALTYKDLQAKLLKLERKHNKNLKEIYQALNLLIEDKTQKQEQANREPIGFKTKST